MNKLNTTIFCLVIVLLFSISTTTNAQEWDDDIRNWESYPLSIGLGLGYKAGVNYVKQPEGMKTGLAFNELPDVGIIFSLPLSSSSFQTFHFELGYSHYPFLTEYVSNRRSTISVTQLSYLTINPNFDMNGFIAGLNIGIPLSGKVEKEKLETKDLKLYAGIKLGGMINVYKDVTGRVYFFFNAEIAFTGVMDGLSKEAEKYNPKIASIQLGFNYLYHLK